MLTDKTSAFLCKLKCKWVFFNGISLNFNCMIE